MLWLADVTEQPGLGERVVRDLVKKSGKPVVLGLNKIDRIPKPQILPAIDVYRHLMDFAAIVPVSALKGENVDALTQQLLDMLPEATRSIPRTS